MKNIPKKIYLQIGGNCPDDIDFKDVSEATWSDCKINKNDIEYILVKKESYASRLYDGLKGNEYK